jgi:hypothetical protein
MTYPFCDVRQQKTNRFGKLRCGWWMSPHSWGLLEKLWCRICHLCIVGYNVQTKEEFTGDLILSRDIKRIITFVGVSLLVFTHQWRQVCVHGLGFIVASLTSFTLWLFLGNRI